MIVCFFEADIDSKNGLTGDVVKSLDLSLDSSQNQFEQTLIRYLDASNDKFKDQDFALEFDAFYNFT